jgi:molybdopterin converting factor small subunit
VIAAAQCNRIGRHRVKVVFYGRLADVIAPELDIAAPTPSIAELRHRIETDFPRAAEILRNGHVRAVVADCVVADDFPVLNAPCVEFLSPVSGG